MACQVNNLFIRCLMNYLLIANLMNSQQSPSAWKNSNKQPQTGQPGPSDYRTAEGGCSLDWKSVLDSLLEHGQEPWGGHLPRTYSLLNCPKIYIHSDLWSLPSPTLPHPCSLIYIFPKLPSFEVNTTPCHTKPSCIAFAYIMRGPSYSVMVLIPAAHLEGSHSLPWTQGFLRAEAASFLFVHDLPVL